MLIHHVQDGENDLEFKWVAATEEALSALPLQPDFIPARIADLPRATEHIVHFEEVPA